MENLIFNAYQVQRSEGRSHREAVQYVLRVVLGMNEEYGDWDAMLLKVSNLTKGERK